MCVCVCVRVCMAWFMVHSYTLQLSVMCKFSTKGSKCQMPFPSLLLLRPLPLLPTFFCSSAGASVPSISNCWHASARSAICPLPRPLSPRPVAYFSAHAILMPIASARTHRVDPTTSPASAPLLCLYLCSLPLAPCTLPLPLLLLLLQISWAAKI